MKTLSSDEAMLRRNRGAMLAKAGNSRRLPPIRCAVLSTFNVAFVEPLLVEAFDRAKLHADVYLGPFGQLEQQALDPSAALYGAPRDAVALVLGVEDMLAALYERPASFTSAEAEAFAEAQMLRVKGVVDAVLARMPDVVCYIVPVRGAAWPMESVLTPNAPQRGQLVVEQFEMAIRRLGEHSRRVVVVDWNGLAHWAGETALVDHRLWYIARMRLGIVGLATLAEAIARHAVAYAGRARKVAVVDLDNTLWGGVVGEVGLRGIVLGGDGLGLAFQDFQRELLKLRDVGVILAVCSKNNPDDAWEVFDRHPEMVLKREHIAAARINWQDKATNLRELAQELNLGIDSLVLLDDNPVEREWIQQALPEVYVPNLPSDPADRPSALRRESCFQRIDVTAADRERADTYRAAGLRNQLQSAVGSFEEFLASLEQQVTIERVNEGSLARAAQLTQRTNQFNLTTRRYGSGELEQLLGDPAVDVLSLAVKDKFGDSGVTGLAILRTEGACVEIDTLLLSCRVLGRRIEDALLGFIVEQARQRGARTLRGAFHPTAKNAIVRDFYAERGFHRLDDETFELDLTTTTVAVPTQIRLMATDA